MKRPLIPAIALGAALAATALVAAPANAADAVTFTGTVTYHGSPVSTDVDWYSPSTGRHGDAHSDVDGAYSLTVPGSAVADFYIAANLDFADLDDYGSLAQVEPYFAGAFYGAGDASGAAWQTLEPYSAPTSHELDITLDRTGTIEVTGVTRPDSVVDLYSPDGAFVNEWWSESGDSSHSFTHLVPGRFYVEVSDSSGSLAPVVSDVITVGSASHTVFDADQSEGASAAGDVTYGGKVVRDLPVIAISSDGWVDGYTTTDSTGHYELEGLLEGDHTIETYPFESGLSDYALLAMSSQKDASRIADDVRRSAGTKARIGVSTKSVSSLRTESGKTVPASIARTMIAKSSNRLLASVGHAASVATTPKTGYLATIHQTKGLSTGATRTIDLSLKAGGRVDGSFTGTKLTTDDVRVVIKNASYYTSYAGSSYRAGTHAFTFTGLPTGTYQIYLASPTGTTYGTKQVVVKAGSSVKASSIPVTRAGLTMNVRAPYAASRSFVWAINETTLTYSYATLGASKSGALHGLIHGTQLVAGYDVTTADYGYSYSFEEIALEKSGGRTVHFRAPQTGRLTGALTVRGIPESDADVEIASVTSWMQGSTWTDEDGSLDENVPVGYWGVYVYSYDFPFQDGSSYSYAPISAHITSGATTALGTVDLQVLTGTPAR